MLQLKLGAEAFLNRDEHREADIEEIVSRIRDIQSFFSIMDSLRSPDAEFATADFAVVDG